MYTNTRACYNGCTEPSSAVSYSGHTEVSPPTCCNDSIEASLPPLVLMYEQEKSEQGPEDWKISSNMQPTDTGS